MEASASGHEMPFNDLPEIAFVIKKNFQKPRLKMPSFYHRPLAFSLGDQVDLADDPGSCRSNSEEREVTISSTFHI